MNLNCREVEEVRVVIPEKDFQQTIEDLVLESNKLNLEARKIYKEAEGMLLEELGLKDFELDDDLYNVVNFSEVEAANRMDAEYFQPKYEKLIAKLKSQNAKLLPDVIQNVPAKFNPVAEPEKAFQYVELSNINSSIGVIDGFSGIVGKEAPSRAKRILKEGDVMVSSIEGSLEKVALVAIEQERHLASTGFFQFRSNEILPEVLLVLAKSLVFQMQLQKLTAGTILSAVPKEAINNVIVPILARGTQEKIAELVRRSHESRKKAKELLESAKRQVEQIIETQSK